MVFFIPQSTKLKNLEITGLQTFSTGFHNPYGYGSFLLFFNPFKPVVSRSKKSVIALACGSVPLRMEPGCGTVVGPVAGCLSPMCQTP
ncbi:hypothetical protein FB106_1077 [Synechococcus sp. Ace-Pa]|nr:hypothetical protein FB106_1077 [Synechococcus sp. Ace-Pa]